MVFEEKKLKTNITAPQPLVVPQDDPLIATSNTTNNEASKQLLGEQLFVEIMKVQPALAGKITGMLLEVCIETLLAF